MLYMCVQHAYVPLPSSHLVSSSFISVLFMFWSEVVQPEEMEPLVQQHSTTKGNICSFANVALPTKHQRQQHAAACRSMPQRQILGAVGGGFEACRSMPQHSAASQTFHMAYFFFVTCQNCEPFIAQASQN